jgi:hypothetical protein
LEDVVERTASEVYELYIARKAEYANRNAMIDGYRALFDGDHWLKPLGKEEQEAEDTLQLVVNFCRSTVLHFVGMLASAPRFRVPRPARGEERRIKAEIRERWLAGLRDDLLRAWSDVEMDASKVRFGVLQVIWDPDVEPANSGNIEGNPFVFRAVDPQLFYPCYRTWHRADDFFYVIREDPGRLVEDLEEEYGVKLQAVEAEPGTEGACTVVEYWDKDDYYLIALTHRELTEVVSGREVTHLEPHSVVLKEGKHGYPRIPFFVLQNIRNAHEDPTEGGSLGDVDAIAGLNRHMDWLFSSHADELALQVHRPIVYKSPSHSKPPESLRQSPGAVWDIEDDEDVSPFAWPAEPEMVQHHFRMTRKFIDDMSFIPATAQGELPAGVSGQSMSIANTPLQRILELKKPQRITTLKAVAGLLLEMGAKKGAPIVTWCTTSENVREEAKLTKDMVEGDYYVEISWRNMLPRDEIAHQAHHAYLFKTGVQTLPRTLDALGVEWVEAELEQLSEEYIDPRINPERAMAYAAAKKALEQVEQQPAAQPPGQQPAAPQPPGAMPPGPMPPNAAEGLGPGPARGTLPVQPPSPPFQQMGQEARLTPFAPREQFGAGALPLRPPGPGINPGGPIQ